MSSAMKPRGTTVVPRQTVVPTSGKEAAEQLACVILQFETGQVSQATKRTKDAVKKWKEGRSMPSAWSLLLMARNIPAVNAWVQAIIGGGDTDFLAPQLQAAAHAALYQAVHDGGPGGEAFREEVAKFMERNRR